MLPADSGGLADDGGVETDRGRQVALRRVSSHDQLEVLRHQGDKGVTVGGPQDAPRQPADPAAAQASAAQSPFDSAGIL